MTDELHRRGVITGSVNCFCLACEIFFQKIEDAVSHIQTSSHHDNLSAIPYLDKFQDQNIRKFKTGYFCEFCNELMRIAAKVHLHIAEDQHIQNRGNNSLKYCNDELIAFDKVCIAEHAWHGMINNVCCICDIEFEDQDVHKLDKSHVLSLIQKPIKFEMNEVIYRKIDDSSIHCLTCNMLLSADAKFAHFEDTEHRNLYAKLKIKARKELKASKEKGDSKRVTNITEMNDVDSKNINENNSCAKEQDISKIMQNISTYLCSDIDINNETEIAYCRKCCVNIYFNPNDIEKHINEHFENGRSNTPDVRYPVGVDRNKYCTKAKKTERNEKCINDDHLKNKPEEFPVILPMIKHSDAVYQDANNNASHSGSVNHELNNSKETFIEITQFARENNITYNSDNSKAFCRTCEVKLPSSIKSIQQHVKGHTHNRNVKKVTKKVNFKQKNTLKKESVATYVNSVKVVDIFCDSGYLINDTYFLDKFSFLLLQPDVLGTGYKCLLCENTVSKLPYAFNEHIKTCSLPAGRKLRVIINDLHEFIREIQPGMFHCGYCNIVTTGWTEMESHLKTSGHYRLKGNCSLRHGVATGYLPLGALILLDVD